MTRPPIALLLVWGLGLAVVIPTALSHVRGAGDGASRGLNTVFLFASALPLLLSVAMWALAGSTTPGRWIAGAVGVLPFALLAAFPISAELARRQEAKLATGEEHFGDPAARAILDALRRGDRDALGRAKAGGADFDATGKGDVTLLTWALFYAPNSAAMLLEAGADPNRLTPDGEHPLQQAVMQDPAVLLAVLKAGADPNARDRNGDPFAFHTLKMRSAPKLRAFVDAGTDIHARDAQGWTLLMRCVQARLWNEGVNLIGRGADPMVVATDDERTSVRDVAALMVSVDSTTLQDRGYQAFMAALETRTPTPDTTSR